LYAGETGMQGGRSLALATPLFLPSATFVRKEIEFRLQLTQSITVPPKHVAPITLKMTEKQALRKRASRFDAMQHSNICQQ
jgi:hypothetical protein